MRRLALACLLAVLSPMAARAGTITVTTPTGVLNNPAPPGPTVTLNDAFATDTWLRVNVRNGSSVGITGDYPRSGNGSAHFTGASGQSKADFELFFSDLTGKTLGNLTSLGYDYYRDAASTNPNVQAPSLRSTLTPTGIWRPATTAAT